MTCGLTKEQWLGWKKLMYDKVNEYLEKYGFTVSRSTLDGRIESWMKKEDGYFSREYNGMYPGSKIAMYNLEIREFGARGAWLLCSVFKDFGYPAHYFNNNNEFWVSGDSGYFIDECDKVVILVIASMLQCYIYKGIKEFNEKWGSVHSNYVFRGSTRMYPRTSKSTLSIDLKKRFSGVIRDYNGDVWMKYKGNVICAY